MTKLSQSHQLFKKKKNIQGHTLSTVSMQVSFNFAYATL